MLVTSFCPFMREWETMLATLPVLQNILSVPVSRTQYIVHGFLKNVPTKFPYVVAYTFMLTNMNLLPWTFEKDTTHQVVPYTVLYLNIKRNLHISSYLLHHNTILFVILFITNDYKFKLVLSVVSSHSLWLIT